MKFPKSVPVKEISSQHCELDQSVAELYDAMYRGGSAMTNEMKKKILIEKQNEKQFQPEVYKERIKRSFYLNRAGGLIDYIISSSTANSPRITVSENATDEQKQFWLSKNINCDGNGKPFSTVFRDILRDQLVSRRSYVETIVGEDKDEIYMQHLCPQLVIDWGTAKDGTEWVKTYGLNSIKSSPFEVEEILQHVWTIYTESETIVYKAQSKKEDKSRHMYFFSDKKDGFEDLADDAKAMRDNNASVENHDFNSLPISRTVLPKSKWLMDRISENIKALYNAESDQAWLQNSACYPQGIFKGESEQRFQKVFNKSADAIWNLLPTEDYKLVSASGIDFKAQADFVLQMKNSLHESMQMMAKEAAQIPQAGRLSGEAVREMRSPLDGLLQSMLWPVVDQFYDTIDAIKKYRDEEELGVYIEGLATSASEVELRKILFGDSVVEEDQDGTGRASVAGREERGEGGEEGDEESREEEEREEGRDE